MKVPHLMQILMLCTLCVLPSVTIGRVLFDETHGVVSDSYNGRYTIDEAYKDWADRLRQRGYEVTANRTEVLNLQLLSQYQVTVISHPTQPFTAYEVTALQQYVTNGGGLLFLADAFGNGTSLNAVNQAFGITINSDVLADWDDSRPTRPFHFFIHTWPTPSPLTAYVDVVMYDWGSSLSLQSPAQAIGTGDQDTWIDNNRNGWLDPGEVVGFPVGIASSVYGSGRVVVIGDSNLFMNMYSNSFDNAQLSSNVIDWLAKVDPVILDPNLMTSTHFKLSVPDNVVGDEAAILEKLEESYNFLRDLYWGDTRYPKTKVQLEPSHPGCTSGCTNCIYNIWSDLSDPYLQSNPLIPSIYNPLLAELGHIFSGKYLGLLWIDTQYAWLGEGLGNWWKVPALEAIGYPEQADATNNWITWAGQEYKRHGYTWISRWNQFNPDQDRELGYGMSSYIVRETDQKYGTAMWHRLFGLIAENETRLLASTDDQKNSYAVCLFNQAANDPTLIDVFTKEWHFQTDSILLTSPTSFVFLHPYEGPPQQSAELKISNCSSQQILTWTATMSPTVSWLSMDRYSGQTPGNALVTIDASGLVPGTYQSTLKISTIPSSLNAPITLPVTLTVDVFSDVPPDYFDTVQKTYIGYYQRPADPGGLIYWAERLDGVDGNLDEIIEAFANSAEAVALYGPINSSTIGDVVDSIYMALFNRAPDPGGKAFYVNGFNSGRFTAATIMLNVLYGAQNEDLQSINNKLTAANLFTRTIDPELDGSNFQVTYAGNADAIAGRNFLAFVTSNLVTVPTQDGTTAYILTNIADPGDAIGESPFTPLPPWLTYCDTEPCTSIAPVVVYVCPAGSPQCTPARSTTIIPQVDGKPISGVFFPLVTSDDTSLRLVSGNGNVVSLLVWAFQASKVILGSAQDVLVSYYNVAPVWGGTTPLNFTSTLLTSALLDTAFYYHPSYDTGTAATDLHAQGQAVIMTERAMTGLTSEHVTAFFMPTELAGSSGGEGNFSYGNGTVTINYGNPPYIVAKGGIMNIALPEIAHEYAHELFNEIKTAFSGNGGCLKEGIADALAYAAGFLPEEGLGPVHLSGIDFDSGCTALSEIHDVGNCYFWHVKKAGLLTPSFLYGIFHPQHTFSFNSCAQNTIETGNSILVYFTESAGGANMVPVLESMKIPHAGSYDAAKQALGL